MTSLGSGERVKKDSPRIEAYGTVDELNSQIGAAIAAGIDPELSGILQTVQSELFHLGSDLCLLEAEKAKRAAPQIEQRHVDALERILDHGLQQLPLPSTERTRTAAETGFDFGRPLVEYDALLPIGGVVQ